LTYPQVTDETSRAQQPKAFPVVLRKPKNPPKKHPDTTWTGPANLDAADMSYQEKRSTTVLARRLWPDS
jgi:hypothetical protein